MQTLDFTQNIVLENDRVLLRPLEAEDFDFLLPYSINEPTLWQYSLTPANGPENLEKYIDFALEKREKKDCYPFIVFDKQVQKYAGSTRFYDYQKIHNTVQLGYTWFGSEFWGTRLNQNCKHLMLSYAFDTADMQRLEFRADYNNKRSIEAMMRLGCTKEGVLRSNCVAGDGSRRDSIVLSILKEEWVRNIKKRLEEYIS